MATLNTAPTFSLGSGIVITDISQSGDACNSMAVQDDGKILLVGGSAGSRVMVRYNADGSLDTNFNGTGKVIGATGSWTNVVLQPDGRILVTGTGTDTSSGTLARYNTDGSLDTSFNGSGIVTTTIPPATVVPGFSYDHGLALQADGKILVAGGYRTFVLGRYNVDGSLDTTFNRSGTVTQDITAKTDQAYSVSVQADGKILVAGVSNYGGGYTDAAVLRYNVDGSLDYSFSSDGKEVTSGLGQQSNEYAIAVMSLSDGRVIIAGSSNNNINPQEFFQVTYLQDGTFAGYGWASVSSYMDYPQSAILQPDGKLLIAGYSWMGRNGYDFSLVRFDGVRDDLSFNGTGMVTTSIGSYNDYGMNVKLQDDGKILVAGYVEIGGTDRSQYQDFAVVRYNPDGSLDTNFGSRDGEGSLNGNQSVLEQNAVVLDSDVQVFDSELASLGHYSGASLTLARHNSENPQDVFLAKFGGTLSDLVVGEDLSVDNTVIGRVTTNTNGFLKLTFNSNATQSLINKAMQQIAYLNNSDAPPTTVQIDWTFNDENTGTQGAGGAMSVTGISTITITPVNDSPTGTASITGTSTQGQTLTASNTLADADGLGTITYTWKAGTTTVGTGSTYTLTQAEVGKTMTVTASYIDGYGTAESMTSAATAAVLATSGQNSGQNLSGTAANDNFTSGPENDYFDGGAGLDQVVFSANRSAYTVSKSDSGFSVSSSPDGTDTLINIERLQFSDVNLALDVSASGKAGQARLFLGTIAHALIDNPGVEGTILYFFDQGMSMQQVCQLAVDVNLISALAGSSSNADLAKLVWRNVVGTEADSSAVDLLLSFMDGRNAAFSQAQLLTAVSQLDINQQRVDLVGLATTGMEYLPFTG